MNCSAVWGDLFELNSTIVIDFSNSVRARPSVFAMLAIRILVNHNLVADAVGMLASRLVLADIVGRDALLFAFFDKLPIGFETDV